MKGQRGREEDRRDGFIDNIVAERSKDGDEREEGDERGDEREEGDERDGPTEKIYVGK